MAMEALSQPQGHTTPNTELVPYGNDPLRTLAQLLFARHSGNDLTRAIVLVPQRAAVPRFRRVLLDVAADGRDALLPPYTGTLSAWASTFVDGSRRLSDTACEAVLLEALQEHPELARRWGTWPLVDSLLALFDEMTRNQSAPTEDLQVFTRVLADGYGAPYPPPVSLSEEARLAHSLWTAWRRQLAAGRLQDPAGAHADGLKRSLECLPADMHIYLAGPLHLSRAEVQWASALLARGQMTLVVHGQCAAHGYHPDTVVTELLMGLKTQPARVPATNAYSQFLDTVFDLQNGDLLSRTHRQAKEHASSPARARLVIHEAADFEQEACAIDVQVRRWRLQGLRHIGIVTNDRKLARRVRALLERANIFLKDAAGWTLSTTSAGTALVRWLDCVERHFAYAPLFDLLRSPFVSLGLERADLRRRVSWFEEGLVLQCNVPRDLNRYRHALDAVRQTLEQRYGSGATSAITDLLDRLELAAHPFTGMVNGRPRPAVDYFLALTESLDALGMSVHYRQDEAGTSLLAELEEMRAALANRALALTWPAFREWLRHNLERRYFQPAMGGSEVRLMGFAESRLYRFETLILAGALREHLPGHVDSAPFFNESVRRQLGLSTASIRRCTLFNDFRRLLEAAPRVVITLRREQQGEAVIASPWVERLRVFHRITYHQSLDDTSLERLARSPMTRIVWHDSERRPEPQGYPSPTLPRELIADKISAAAHQHILDCPYQYFAAEGLALAPTATVHEQLDKLDYGERVHRILQAFHMGAPGLPGPFDGPLTGQTRVQAETLLRDIARVVFDDDIRASIFARGWLFRWESSVKAYLDWEIQRASVWRTTAAEVFQRRVITNGETTLTLTARIDRLDQSDDHYSIIDYKTGRVPELAAVTTGEHVQLPIYVLVSTERVMQALFLGLGATKASDKVKLDGQELTALAEQVRQRVLGIQQSLYRGVGLPAWGDDRTCARCPMQGLCRKEMWLAETP